MGLSACSGTHRAMAPIVLPLEIRSGMPTIAVRVDGIPFELFVDLAGYAAVGLTPAELAQMDVQYVAEPTRSVNAAGTIVETRRFVVPDLVLGDTRFENLQGSEFVAPAESMPPDRNGYIGFALLSQFLLVIDYPRRTLRLFRSGEPGVLLYECGPNMFDVEVVHGVAQSVARTDVGWRRFTWDTGSRRSVMRPLAVDRAKVQTSESGGSSRDRQQRFELGGHDVGPQDFAVIEYPALGADGVLGTDFFQSRVVCLDIRQGIGAAR